MLVAVLGIDDVDRLLAAAHALDEERIDHRALFVRAGHERAGVEVVTELGVGERAGEGHGAQGNTCQPMRHWRPPTTCFKEVRSRAAAPVGLQCRQCQRPIAACGCFAALAGRRSRSAPFTGFAVCRPATAAGPGWCSVRWRAGTRTSPRSITATPGRSRRERPAAKSMRAMKQTRTGSASRHPRRHHPGRRPRRSSGRSHARSSTGTGGAAAHRLRHGPRRWAGALEHLRAR